jgi:hypothetical protein
MKPSQTAQALLRIAQAINNSKNPDRKRVAIAIKGVLASIDDGEIYHHGEDWYDGDVANSQLLWKAMEELKMANWAPKVDPNIVYQKMQEIATEYGVTDIKDAMEYAQANWASAKKYNFKSVNQIAEELGPNPNIK